MWNLFYTCATRVFIHNSTVSWRCKCEIYFSHALCDYLYINLLCFLEMKMWSLYFACAMRLFTHNVTVLFGDEMSLILPGLIKILSFYRRKGNKKIYFTHNFSTWIVPYFRPHKFLKFYQRKNNDFSYHDFSRNVWNFEGIS